MAENAVQRIDYDFEHLKVDVINCWRAKQLIFGQPIPADHPNDSFTCQAWTAVFSVDPPPQYAGLMWISQRLSNYAGLYPERAGYTMIASSLEERWLVYSR
jgi:hypothetical protein